MASNQVAIIIPAFNEADSIGNVIDELRGIIGSDIHVVVVNDCSSDDTGIIASKAGAIAVNLKVNHGYAQAINQGLLYASSVLDVKYMVTMDADGQHDPKSVNLVIQSMLTGEFDLIAGYRAQFARLSEKLYGKYFNYKFSIKDPLCGLKAYNVKIYRQYGCFETYDSIGTELLSWSLIEGIKVHQMPINIRDRKDDIPRFGSLWAANKRIILSLFTTIRKVNKRNFKPTYMKL